MKWKLGTIWEDYRDWGFPNSGYLFGVPMRRLYAGIIGVIKGVYLGVELFCGNYNVAQHKSKIARDGTDIGK